MGNRSEEARKLHLSRKNIQNYRPTRDKIKIFFKVKKSSEFNLQKEEEEVRDMHSPGWYVRNIEPETEHSQFETFEEVKPKIKNFLI